MNDNRAIVGNGDPALESLAAELTAAAYPVALRHGPGSQWLDLELDLWRVLAETVRKSGQALLPADPGAPGRRARMPTRHA